MRKWLKRVIPTPAEMHGHRWLSVFGELLHDPNLWHLNRRSVSGAVAVGLFVMYLPPLGHLLIAAALAIRLRVNLPIAVTLVLISNPLTIPAMYYFAYILGCWMLDIPPGAFSVQFWFDWHNWLGILEPLLLGCLICATSCSLVGYVGIRLLWRWKLVRQVERRRARYRALFKSTDKTPSSSRQI